MSKAAGAAMLTLRKRVLIVEDDEQVLQSVQIALEEEGFEVLTARDGAEGLMRAERDQPDLIVLDVVLPRRSGFTVLERLRQSPFRSPPIIVLSANDEPKHRTFATACGASAFFAKPFDMGDLLGAVHTLL